MRIAKILYRETDATPLVASRTIFPCLATANVLLAIAIATCEAYRLTATVYDAADVLQGHIYADGTYVRA